MIYVTVGSAVEGMEFDRLIRKMDEIAPRLDERVVMQIGSSAYQPRHTSFFSYAPFQEMLEYFHKAKMVVGHCGSGTVLNAIRFEIPLIVVPRMVALGEHDLDDHQMVLAKKLEGRNGIKVVYDVEMLEASILETLADPTPFLKEDAGSNRQSLISGLKKIVNEIEQEMKRKKCVV